jgi:hypothetical protein
VGSSVRMRYQGDRGTWRELSGRAFVASQGESQKRLGDREAILFVSASITWIRDGLVPTDTTG